MRDDPTPRRGGQPRLPDRGFTLIEIMVVITLIVLLTTFGVSQMKNAMEKGRVTKCQDNLRQIGTSLRLYKDTRNKGRWPKEGGIRFLLTLHRHKEITGRSSDVFLCPGTPNVFNDGGPSGEPGSSYDDWSQIDSGSISYAGRDRFPISSANEGNEALAADDNEYEANHRTVTNILYADGAVVPFDLFIDGADILEQYPEYEDPAVGLPVGPESPHPPLQDLSVH